MVGIPKTGMKKKKKTRRRCTSPLYRRYLGPNNPRMTHKYL
jgi:hypothetical protein